MAAFHLRWIMEAMARKSPTAVPIPTFLGKHWSRMEQAHAAEYRRQHSTWMALAEVLNRNFELPPMSTSGPEWERVAEWWPFCVLQEAAMEGDREGCKRLLHFFLSALGIRLPKGVLTPFLGTRGRPKETEAIHKAWVAQGRPKMTWRICEDLARTFYPSEMEQAKSDTSFRRKLRTRIRVTILRHELAVTKFARIS